MHAFPGFFFKLRREWAGCQGRQSRPSLLARGPYRSGPFEVERVVEANATEAQALRWPPPKRTWRRFGPAARSPRRPTSPFTVRVVSLTISWFPLVVRIVPLIVIIFPFTITSIVPLITSSRGGLRRRRARRQPRIGGGRLRVDYARRCLRPQPARLRRAEVAGLRAT